MYINYNKVGGSHLPIKKKDKLKLYESRVAELEASLSRIYTYAINIKTFDEPLLDIIYEEFYKN